MQLHFKMQQNLILVHTRRLKVFLNSFISRLNKESAATTSRSLDLQSLL